MRYFILIFLCFTYVSASAQWWRIGPFKHKRYSQIALIENNALSKIPVAKTSRPKIKAHVLPNYYDLRKAEAATMKSMKHNMRYRIYKSASYDFSELARIYVQLNRLSEAKWFLLQSNLLTRRQNDNRHTFANLVCLASVKMDMGDVSLARRDLMEARDIANDEGWIFESREMDKKIKSIQDINTIAPKTELKYAETAEVVNNSK